ncbi:MAG: hypothetical protein WCB04_10260, partial [Mycobacteriales bacterium]
MSQPPQDSDYFTPPPQVRPYGAPIGTPMPPAPGATTAEPGPGQPRLATPGRRLLARAFDSLAVSLIALPF